VIVLITPDFEVGSQPPTGYLAWHEWAETQSKAGLKQSECGVCGSWNFPQELSGNKLKQSLKTANGKTKIVEAEVCKKCTAPPAPEGE
jgi:hypothetical protein